MWSSRGGKPERTLGEHPHVLGGRVVCRKAVDLVSFMPPARACTAGATSLLPKGRCLVRPSCSTIYLVF